MGNGMLTKIFNKLNNLLDNEIQKKFNIWLRNYKTIKAIFEKKKGECLLRMQDIFRSVMANCVSDWKQMMIDARWREHMTGPMKKRLIMQLGKSISFKMSQCLQNWVNYKNWCRMQALNDMKCKNKLFGYLERFSTG